MRSRCMEEANSSVSDDATATLSGCSTLSLIDIKFGDEIEPTKQELSSQV